MNFSDYAELDAVGISTAIRKGEVSSQEVTDKAIEVAELMNPDLNALVLTNYDNARSFAAGKLPETPVSGVPFYLKDVNQFSHDMPTTFSCRFFESASPKEDSELVRRWRQAGEPEDGDVVDWERSDPIHLKSPKDVFKAYGPILPTPPDLRRRVLREFNRHCSFCSPSSLARRLRRCDMRSDSFSRMVLTW